MQIIRVIDLETTGLTPETSAPCEIGWCDIAIDNPGGTQAPHGCVTPLGRTLEPHSALLHPGHPIPPETSAIHHITDADVRFAAHWTNGIAEVVGEAWALKEAVAFAAHKAKFERQWCEEFSGDIPWICTYKCALRLWPDAPSHSNQSLRYWRKPGGLDRETASVSHRAGPDAYVTAHLLRDMLTATYDGGTRVSLAKLIEWSSQPALQVTCHIGKWRGHKWTEVDDGFLHWISGKDFDEDVLLTVRTEIERREREYQERVEGADDDPDFREVEEHPDG